MRKLVLGFTVLGLGAILTGCGGDKAFTKGEYDDPNRVQLLDDRFNEADMQQLADEMIKKVLSCKSISNAKKPPLVIVETVMNRTEEHIDMSALTDMIRTNLINSGKVGFINKEERGTLDDEYKYNEGGNVSGPTQKKRGAQIGADYILSGRLATNVQQVGPDKFIYYKLNVNLTNMDTSAIDCAQDHQLRKKFKRQSVGL